VLPAFTTVAAANGSQWVYPHDRDVRRLARFGLIDDVSIAIVHKQGQGESGVTLSWCCAAEVANLVAMA
jgi:hypothetical protein